MFGMGFWNLVIFKNDSVPTIFEIHEGSIGIEFEEIRLGCGICLFEGTHVPDIVSTSGKAAASGAVSKDALIAELKDTCKVLEATIKATTGKKMELERLIKRLSESGIDDGEAAEEEEAAEQEEEEAEEEEEEAEEEDAAEETESDDDDSEATPWSSDLSIFAFYFY